MPDWASTEAQLIGKSTMRRHLPHEAASDTDLWAELAKDWICDEEAKGGKAARYYADIVEH